jgi:hypothetical protein
MNHTGLILGIFFIEIADSGRRMPLGVGREAVRSQRPLSHVPIYRSPAPMPAIFIENQILYGEAMPLHFMEVLFPVIAYRMGFNLYHQVDFGPIGGLWLISISRLHFLSKISHLKLCRRQSHPYCGYCLK